LRARRLIHAIDHFQDARNNSDNSSQDANDNSGQHKTVVSSQALQ
jgi:hypothetical protein